MASLASARLLVEKFNFVVNIDAISTAFFMKMSELTTEFAEIKYYEGGTLIPIKWPGRVTMSDLTLERGVGTDSNFDTWARQVVDTSLAGGHGAGLPPVGFTRNMTVTNKDRTKLGVIRKYQIYGAWPKKYNAAAWDNTVDEVDIESIVITFDRYELIVPTPATIAITGV
jgi:phage tail-like protein